MLSPDTLSGYEDGLVFAGCEWSQDHQDACLMCAGGYCCLCITAIAGRPCEHDSLARHYSIPAHYREPAC